MAPTAQIISKLDGNNQPYLGECTLYVGEVPVQFRNGRAEAPTQVAEKLLARGDVDVYPAAEDEQDGPQVLVDGVAADVHLQAAGQPANAAVHNIAGVAGHFTGTPGVGVPADPIGSAAMVLGVSDEIADRARALLEAHPEKLDAAKALSLAIATDFAGVDLDDLEPDLDGGEHGHGESALTPRGPDDTTPLQPGPTPAGATAEPTDTPGAPPAEAIAPRLPDGYGDLDHRGIIALLQERPELGELVKADEEKGKARKSVLTAAKAAIAAQPVIEPPADDEQTPAQQDAVAAAAAYLEAEGNSGTE